MIQLGIFPSARSPHPVTTRQLGRVQDKCLSPLYLQLNYPTSILLEALVRLESFRSGDFTTVQDAQLWKGDDDVITVAGIIWRDRQLEEHELSWWTHRCRDCPWERAPASAHCTWGSRRSLSPRWSSTWDPTFAATHILPDFQSSRRYLLPNSGTRAFSIWRDFLDDCGERSESEWMPKLNWIITNSRDQVGLQEEDFQLTAPILNVLNPLDILLMQRELLEAEDEQLVVLRLFPDELLGNCKKSNRGLNLIEEIRDEIQFGAIYFSPFFVFRESRRRGAKHNQQIGLLWLRSASCESEKRNGEFSVTIIRRRRISQSFFVNKSGIN